MSKNSNHTYSENIEPIKYNPYFNLREPFLAISHLAGAVLGILGTILLAYYCGDSLYKLTVVVVYGVCLTSCFLISGLLHGIYCTKEQEYFLEKLDYVSIYLFIAGTYTPFCALLVGGSLGTQILYAQWILAAIGIWSTLRWGFGGKALQISIFILMGWMFLLIFGPISALLTSQNFSLLVSGGLFYSIGALIFAFAPEDLWKTKISSHAVWHVFVLLGASAHYLMIFNFTTGNN